MQILYLTSWLPFPLSTGAKVRNYYLLKYLSEKHKIDLLSFIFNKEEENNISGLKGICKRVKVVLIENKKHSIQEHIIALFSGKPRSIQLSYSSKMFNFVFDWITENKYDLVITDSLIMAEYILNIKYTPKVIDHHNIDAVILERDYKIQKSPLKKFRRWLTWKKGLKYEIEVSRKIDAHTFVSLVDKNILMDFISETKLFEIIPNGVDLNNFYYYSYEKVERDSSLIVFSSLLKYQANLEGLRYFCENIFPIIKKSHPYIKLIVTGDYNNLLIDDLRNDKNIDFVGYVDDVKKIILKASVTIVPLRIGSGTRFKILESMALGTPVVSTTIGAEGIEGLKPISSQPLPVDSLQSPVNGYDKNIWIADTPENFAEGVLSLLSNKQLAGAISKNGRRLIEEKYSWTIIANSMDNFLEKVKEKGSKQRL